jgi:hypothetical protein
MYTGCFSPGENRAGAIKRPAAAAAGPASRLKWLTDVAIETLANEWGGAPRPVPTIGARLVKKH